jgi:hypothetical protein
VYYAAALLETAVAETMFHFENFTRDSADPQRSEDFRVLVGTVASSSRMLPGSRKKRSV